jgi:hypothetical protein
MARHSKSTPERGPSALASRRELNEFLEGIKELRERVPLEDQDQALRAYILKNATREQQQRLFGRAFVDALKSPSQKLGTAKAPAQGRVEGRGGGRGSRAARKKKSRR